MWHSCASYKRARSMRVALDCDLRRVGIEIPSHAGLGVRSHQDRGLKAAAQRAETHRPNWRVVIVFGCPRSLPIAGCSNNWLTAPGFEREPPRRLLACPGGYPESQYYGWASRFDRQGRRPDRGLPEGSCRGIQTDKGVMRARTDFLR